MKQTAVEWLVEQMRIRKEQGLTLSLYDLEMFAEQAKAMEKEQIKDAHKDGYDIPFPRSMYGYIGEGEYYYKKTYGKDERD